MKIHRFEDLECWREARILVNLVYDAIADSHEFQKDMRLRDQCKGASISVMGAIPEGFVRRSNKEFVQFLFISISSAAELQSHFYVALDRRYVTQSTFEKIYTQCDKVSRMVSGLITYLLKNIRLQKSTKQTKQTR
jgi:four helix bundle protein